MLQISNLSFAYQNKNLFENLNLIFTAPEKVAIIGDNGAGKTTLLKIIAGELPPETGAIQTKGDIGFLHQSQEDLVDKSGGERTKIKLVELFRCHPAILLLDEPTNNLDAETKLWLIRNLAKYRGLVLIVSHDRDFIDQIADRILHLQNGKAEIFTGNYTDFIARQTERRHQMQLDYAKVRSVKQKLEQQLKHAGDSAHKSNRRAFDKTKDESRMRYNAKRGAAQNSAGKILRATRSKLEQLSQVEKPAERKTYQAQVSSNFLHRKKLLEVSHLAKSFPPKVLFSDLSFTIYTGERLRIKGKNGTGKSTLFKIILGKEKADAGEIKLHDNLRFGYISQNGTTFDLTKSFIAQNPTFAKTEIYRAASTMDFAPVELEKPAGNLSRGQLTKLAILKLILAPLDLIILDEITNHLDIRARENIELALQNYQGAILAATHDETFAQNLHFGEEITL